MKINFIISYLVKIVWTIVFLLIIFLDRNNSTMVIITIGLLFFITLITVIRSLVSRNEWREIIEDGDVEIKDKIKF
ncbi:MAG: hypothetical protein CMG09_07050 [Candidatus Marinimicrobia bacterium]|nr:hypothetical protein [Candidatus Neomarinimicrobiota bacterium]